MHPAIIRGHTHRFTAPEGREDVSTLFVRQDSESGLPMLRSAWEAKPNEIGLLLAGAKIHLGIAVPVHPVVNLSIADLPEDFEPVFTARRLHCVDRGQVLRIETIVASPPFGLRFWVETTIVSGIAAAFAEGVGVIAEQVRARGLNL